METFSVLQLALLCGELTGRRGIPAQRPVTQSFDVFFDLRLNKRLSKQSWGWWFGTPSCPLWRHCYGMARSTWDQDVTLHVSLLKSEIPVLVYRKEMKIDGKSNTLQFKSVITA